MAIYVFANLNGDTKYVATNDVVFNGTWSSAGTYFPPMDAVNYGSSQYIVLIQNSGSVPLSSGAWSELVLFRADPNPPGPDPVAEQALELAEQAYTLACIGTNVGTNALELAQQALSQSAGAAYNLAAIGTNVGTNALNLAQSALDGLNGALQIIYNGTNIANSAYTLAAAGTNLGQEALSIACIGTNVGTNALIAAAHAEADAQSALSGVGSVYTIAVAGTNLAAAAYALAVAGTNQSPSAAYNLAAIGTNVGTNALNAATAAQFTANSAISGVNGVTVIAVAGTNLAQAAFNIACIGTNVGSNAYNLASSGSNIAFSGSILSWYASNAHQKITTLDADPNLANIFPFDRTIGCTFRQDPSITLYNEWEWSPNQQRWYQTISLT